MGSRLTKTAKVQNRSITPIQKLVCWGKARAFAAQFDDLLSESAYTDGKRRGSVWKYARRPEADADVMAMANARALCVVLLIEMATDFDSRVVQVATSLPMTLAWLPHGPPSRAVSQRQTVASEMLSLLEQNDELTRQSTPWKLAFLFKDQLQGGAATGCIGPTLPALLERLAAEMSSGTQEIDGD